MSEAWRTALLDDLVERDSPITYGVVKPGDPGEVPFVRGGDIAHGQVLEAQLRTITSAVSQQYKRTLLRGGELLVSLVGQPGQVAVASQSLAGANIARQVGLIRLQSFVDAQFVCHFLRSPDGIAGLRKFTGGSVQQVINLSDLRQVEVPVPSLNVQRRIVTLLDEAFEGIATAKAHAELNLRNAESLFCNEVENLFACPPQDWREVPLGAAGNTQTGSSPKSSDLASFGSDVPFIKPGDFNRDGTLNYENDGLSFLGAERARLVQPGSVLMVCIGTLGKVGCNDRVVSMNQQINSWTPIAGVLPKFMYYQMLSSDFQHRVRSNAGQTTLAIINKSKWSALKVRIPNDIKVQRDVVARLDEFMEASVQLKAIYQRKLTALTELQQSLLHQAFSGQL